MRRYIDIINEHAGMCSLEHDDWQKLRYFLDDVKNALPSDKLIVFRGTRTIEGQDQSANYHATYFTSDMGYVQEYSDEDGYLGVYLLSNLEKFLDLRYGYPEEEWFERGEETHRFEMSQRAKIAALAQRYFDKEPTTDEVYAMLEDPQPDFIAMLRQEGYYGLLTSEGDYSKPVYAVFNEHIKDCIEHKPFDCGS